LHYFQECVKIGYMKIIGILILIGLMISFPWIFWVWLGLVALAMIAG